MADQDSLVLPDWSVPKWVGGFVTTRMGGCSPAPWDSMNLGINTSDSCDNVRKNRQTLMGFLPPGIEVQWMKQVHGPDGVIVEKCISGEPPTADFCYTSTPGIACAVLTADCLPVLICNQQGSEVAAVHAGWRGIAGGVLQQAIDVFQSPAAELQAWIGPCIGQRAFEVGAEVPEAMLDAGLVSSKELNSLMIASPKGQAKVCLDLAGLVRQGFQALGVTSIHGGSFCTYSEPRKFFSYRRDGETGRMASLIWIDLDQK